MSTHTYPIDPAECVELFRYLTEHGFSAQHRVIDGAGEITIVFDVDLTADETAVLDAAMGNYDGELYTARALRMRNVDVRTRELLAQGFLYDGHVFSLSLEAQANWNRMIAKHAADKLTFPTDEVSTFYGVRHSFVDAASFNAFADAYLAAVDTVIESGRALKDQINAATTVGDVNAVIDDR